MKRTMRRSDASRGSALMISMIVISAIGAIGAGLMILSLSQNKLTVESSEKEIALLAAESGLDRTVYSMNAWTARPWSANRVRAAGGRL